MKVLHVNMSSKGGGAAVASMRLHDGLRDHGVCSHYSTVERSSVRSYVLRPLSKWQNLSLAHKKRISRRVSSLQHAPTNQVFHSIGLLSSGLGAWINDSDFDIVNLHWVGGDTLSIKEIARINKPIVWTMHDMWPFMGAEHYDDLDHPGRWKTRYTVANRPATYRGADIDRYVWLRKARYWRDKRFNLLAPSRWLAQCAQDSALMGEQPCEIIPNPLDTDTFLPVDQYLARQLLGLPTEKKLLLFGAMDSTTDPRKGFDLLITALQRLASDFNVGRDIDVVVFGSDKAVDIPKTEFAPHVLGTFHDTISLPLIYSAADVFVAPSRQDNLPNTVAEAGACGVPTAAFDIGGMSDLVVHGKTGILARPFDCSELSLGIYRLLTSPPARENVRAAMLARVSHEVTIPMYISLYSRVLGLAHAEGTR